MEEPEDREKKSRDVPIDWHIPDDFPTPYASNMFVQPGEYEFTLSFFRTHMPLLTGTPEENRETVLQLESIPADCVGRVIVNPELVPKIIKALQTTYDQYLETKAALKAEEEEEEA